MFETTPRPATFAVRGRKVRSQSQRRYIVVAVRPESIATEENVVIGARSYCRVSDRCLCSEPIVTTRPATYVAFAEVVKRSDSIETARREAARYGFHHGAFAVVVDTVTGEEV